MHVVAVNFLIRQAGILGFEFLKDQDAVLSLEKNSVTLEDYLGTSIPSLPHSTIHLSARTKQLCTLAVQNLEEEGKYIPRFEAGPGIYGGECLVTVTNDICEMFIINPTMGHISLTLPPVILREFQTDTFPRKLAKLMTRCTEKQRDSEREKRILNANSLSESAPLLPKVNGIIEARVYRIFIGSEDVKGTGLVTSGERQNCERDQMEMFDEDLPLATPGLGNMMNSQLR
ncbi:hypothetical protein QAD02_020161 [Eretmocerus hayati]|uniref:Uncharacterized protein n=1 Tax=Eretmocerus hayati TaxID=131215 RepID=A0ACC2PLB0_9HYME|nr:hypothetical protein QAD02_020161 [Eretmocerus hayati]